MNKATLVSIFASVAMAATTAAGATDYTKTYNFAFSPHSRLSTGKWVKISIGENGVYEITHDKLREMGFSNPERVAVYGQPGYLKSNTFLNATGIRQLEDDLLPVRTMHTAGKLFFYGQGTAKISTSFPGADATLHPEHVRSSKSPYSDMASYFLTDSHAIEAVPLQATEDEASKYATAYAYKYFEEDKLQNSTGTGPTFWGDEIRSGSPVVYQFEAPYCEAGLRGTLISDLCILSDKADGLVNIVVNGHTSSSSLASKTPNIWTFSHNSIWTKMDVDAATHIGKAKITFSVSDSYNYSVGIDYWTMSYPLSLEYARNDSEFAQQYVSFAADKAGGRRHALPEGCVAWDVTGGKDPEQMASREGFFFIPGTAVSEAIVFNPSRPQKQIGTSYQTVANQDLHGLIQEGADLLVFSTNELLPYARRLAALHEKYDGIKVVVVTPETVYNEFTSGTPDPMAYRMLCKLLYQSPATKLKNALFFGPLYCDYRNISGVSGRPEGHAVFMQEPQNLLTPSLTVMDYYGSVSDRVVHPESMQSARVRVGIGVLPVSSADEAELVLAKTENHLSQQDFSGIVNETMVITCPGDAHIHDNQGARLGEQYRTLLDERLGTQGSHCHVWLQGTGYEGGNAQIHSALNRGKLLSTYFGHAAPIGFNGFNVHDAMNLENKEQGFLMLAACSLTMPDKGLMGIGDRGVIGTRNGFAGIIASTRSVLSNYNEDLMIRVNNALVTDFDGNDRTATPTIGEVFATAKDKASNESEAAYMLIGDPALRVPFPLTPMEVNVKGAGHRGGDIVEVSGRVLNPDGSFRSDYNGFVTVKAMEPETSFSLKAEGDDILDTIHNRDTRLVAVKGEVKEGRFTVKLPLPMETNRNLGNPENPGQLRILASTYSPESYLAASGYAPLELANAGDEPSAEAEKDTERPKVSVAYDPELSVIRIEASDNVGLLPGAGKNRGVTITLDGASREAVGHSLSDGTAVTSWSGWISTARLEEGEHTVRYRANDVAGNTTEIETYKFTIAQPQRLTLFADRQTAVDEMTFTIAGTAPEAMELMVVSADGSQTKTFWFNGKTARPDLNGLPAGKYRACARPDSGRGAKVNSNWVDFTILD